MTIHLGEMHAASWGADPKHLGFVLARYHVVARLLTGTKNVLEVGCGDCTGARLVKQTVEHLEGCDVQYYPGEKIIKVYVHDICRGPLLCNGSRWDAIYALDVFEHIAPDVEHLFFNSVNDSLSDTGALILGLPSLESQPYASELSKRYHVNCKSEQGLREALNKYYHNVFLFGMNDMTLHVGYGPFCHYRVAIATNKRRV